jgi:tight adherence protein B
MILLLLILITLAIASAFYWFKYQKNKRLHSIRINRYLDLAPLKSRGSAALLLFNKNSQHHGWRLWLFVRQQRLVTVVPVKLAWRLGIFAALLLPILWWSTLKLPAYWQVIVLICFYIVISISVVRWLQRRQLQHFEADFPKAIASISRAVSAGVSVPAAIAHVSEEMAGPVGDTFTRINNLLAIGLSLEQALQDATLRIKLASFKFFTVTLLLNQHAGGQLSQILRQLMENLHQRKALQQKVLAMTAEPRTSAKIIAIMPPLFLLLFWYQAKYIFDYLLYDERGQIIATYSTLSIILGLYIIAKMSKVDE